MNKPTPILFVRQKHDAKRAGLHYDFRVVIDDKAFSWASRKDFPEVGKPTILWEQPVHTASYATTPNILIPEGQYIQKGSSTYMNNAYHLDLNNGDRFLIKKAPEHYGEKAWLFLRKKTLDEKNKYLEKVAASGGDISTAVEGYTGAGLIFGSGRIANTVGVKMKKPINEHRSRYMAEAKRAGKEFSPGYMSKLKAGAAKNAKMIDHANSAVKGTRVAIIGAGLGLIGHAVYREGKKDNGRTKKASEGNIFLEKIASEKKKDQMHGWTRAGTVAGTTLAGTLATAPLQMGLSSLAMKGYSKPSRVTEADVNSYRKAKNLRHVLRTGNTWHSPDHHGRYAPSGAASKRPFVSANSPEVAMHEYGHAHSFNKYRKSLGSKGLKVKGIMHGISSQATLLGLAGAAGAYAATSDNEKARKVAPYAVAASALPMLVEEAHANLSPAKHLLKTRGSRVAAGFLAKRSLPYGTYLAATAAGVGTTMLTKHLKEKAIKKANPK